MKKSVISMEKEGDIEEREAGQPINAAEGDAENTTNTMRASTAESDKVTGYDNEYIPSSDPGSYENTSEGSSADDVRRHRSRRNNYDPNVSFKDFFIGLQFENLKLFKGELVEFLTRKGFEFSYIKNDSVRVRAKCSTKGYKWLILCSWCSGKKVHIMKHYVADHSCILGATKNRRVTIYVVAKRFGRDDKWNAFN